ncbi:MAG: 16S rRNA (cytidine(1402)-2'-O)-methyltransferase [Gammaproteobacteria bacterium]|nr:16S rRNA (cytidine(1402)-2'-O)-methyltransferase [Gammaproteobacteria bacterium]
MSIENGVLYVVATPIGNLQDLSPRAQTVLREAARIAAEDTRHSRHLLDHYGIAAPLQALHEHNEQKVSPGLIRRLQEGDSIALISDAGTPLISDPGAKLVQAAHAHKLPVRSIPGPCALSSALSVAGLPADCFIFEGFLPAKAEGRRQHLEKLREETRTMVFYEAPHRISDCLRAMCKTFGDARPAVLVKELTKYHETVRNDSLAGIKTWLESDDGHTKGEFVLVVSGVSENAEKECDPEAERILRILLNSLPLKQAARLTSDITGVHKNILYSRGLQIHEAELPADKS